MDLISNSLVQRLGLPSEQKQKIMLWSVNGKEVVTQGRWTTLGTLTALKVGLAKHSFYVAPTGQFKAIVRLPWLQKMAPSIDWARGLLLLQNSRGDPCAITSSVAFAGPGIPQEYADYAGLFNKKAANLLPAHQEWDHYIPWEKGKLPPHGPIYGLTPIKVEALRKEVNKNLEQGFIQPSTLPAGAPILFVKKKNRGLQLCVNYQGLNQICDNAGLGLGLGSGFRLGSRLGLGLGLVLGS